MLEAALSASGESCLGMTELSLDSRHFGEAEPAFHFDLWPIYQMSKLELRLLRGVCLCTVNYDVISNCYESMMTRSFSMAVYNKLKMLSYRHRFKERLDA